MCRAVGSLRSVLIQSTAVVLMAFAFRSVAAAQDAIVLRPPLEELSPDVEEKSREPAKEPGPIDHRSLLADLGSLRLGPDSCGRAFVNEVCPSEEAPGSVVVQYHGLQAIAVRRIMGYYRRLTSDQLQAYWFGRSPTPIEMDAEVERVAGGDQDVWWRRTWRQSLTPENGGAPVEPVIRHVGHEIEVVRLGELSLTTEGRVRCEWLRLKFENEWIPNAIKGPLSSLMRQRFEARLQHPVPQLMSERRSDLSVRFEDDASIELERLRSAHPWPKGETPRGNLWTGDGWNLSFRPTLQIRLPKLRAPETAIGSISAQIDFMAYTDRAREPWVAVSLHVCGQPAQRQIEATLEAEILRW